MTTTKKNYDEPIDCREAGLGKPFLGMVAERQAVTAQIAELEAAKKSLSEDITAALAETGYKTVLTPDFRVTFTQGSNRTISKQRLLELGVAAKTIDKATKITTYETVTVTANGKVS